MICAIVIMDGPLQRCCWKFFKTIESELALGIADDGPFTAALRAVGAAHEKNTNVLVKAANRKMIKELILSRGVAEVLEDEFPVLNDDSGLCLAANLIAVLYALDHFLFFYSSRTLGWREVLGSIPLKDDDAIYGCERSIIRYFHKRSPCACLKAKYSASKSLPKTGICFYCCTKRKPRSDFLVCQGCKAVQVCSYECHIENWADHKGLCREIRRRREDTGR